MVNPTNTDVCDPRIACPVMPAFSSASQATSSNSRCWGSIPVASRGDMPKNSASNSSGCHEVRKPPSRVQIVPGTVWSASNTRRRPTVPRAPARCRSHHRSTSRQYWAGVFTPPGNRHPIPTTAIGSISPFSAISSRALKSSILRNASVIIARRSAGAPLIALNPAFPKAVGAVHRR